MDVSGAFDNAPYHHIIEAMIEAEAPIEFTRFYKNYLNNRQTTIKFGSCQKTKRLTVGVGQGSILSSVAWNFYLNRLLISCNNGTHIVTGYADD